MATRETVKKSSKLSQSVGAGMKSLFGGGGRTYYILEHKVSSDKYHAGQHQEIIIDYIELGRDPKCQVRFGEEFGTVSGTHAAITKEGNNWVLKNLSKSNPTLINGQPVAKQFFLQNGDEIQLSMEGPKLGFLIPVQNSVKSIGMTRRLSLFRQQALRPYKQAITVISIIFLLALGSLGFFLWQQNKVIDEQMITLNELSQNINKFEGDADSLSIIISENEATQNLLKRQLENLQEIVNENPSNPPPTTPPTTTTTTLPPELDYLYPSVYFITVDKIIVSNQGVSEETTNYGWTGTGFLLDNKKFITARHVIEGWFFAGSDDIAGININLQASNGGTVVAYFTAYSPDGTTLSFKNTDFNFDKSSDEIAVTNDDNGNSLQFTKVPLNGKDWASYITNKTGIISANTTISQNLQQSTALHILGYPLGAGANSLTDIAPYYSSCPVARDGLDNGIIPITGRSFDHGNSGGPVFILNTENKYEAVGIISAGRGETIGMIVPVSAVR